MKERLSSSEEISAGLSSDRQLEVPTDAKVFAECGVGFSKDDTLVKFRLKESIMLLPCILFSLQVGDTLVEMQCLCICPPSIGLSLIVSWLRVGPSSELLLL